MTILASQCSNGLKSNVFIYMHLHTGRAQVKFLIFCLTFSEYSHKIDMLKEIPDIEAWLSLVERCVRDAEVVGSNPVASTLGRGNPGTV